MIPFYERTQSSQEIDVGFFSLGDVCSLSKAQANKVAVRVTDPCYSISTFGTHTVDNAMEGLWRASVSLSGSTIEALVVNHENYDYVTLQASWKLVTDNIGVDSGQAGFFDSKYYPIGCTGEHGRLGTFYGMCCKLTLDGLCGVLPYGAVSSSGHGDDTYSLYSVEKNGYTVAMKLVFIEKEDENDKCNHACSNCCSGCQEYADHNDDE